MCQHDAADLTIPLEKYSKFICVMFGNSHIIPIACYNAINIYMASEKVLATVYII